MILDGRELVEFELWGGKSKSMCMVMNVNTVITTTEDNYHQSVRAIATQLKTSQLSIRRILKSELGTKRVCSAWVPHFLRIDKIQACFCVRTENLAMITDEPEFQAQVLQPVSYGSITDNELWIHHYDPFWKNESSSDCIKARSNQRKCGTRKVMVKSCLLLSLIAGAEFTKCGNKDVVRKF